MARATADHRTEADVALRQLATGDLMGQGMVMLAAMVTTRIEMRFWAMATGRTLYLPGRSLLRRLTAHFFGPEEHRMESELVPRR
jgi:hypothetical protein